MLNAYRRRVALLGWAVAGIVLSGFSLALFILSVVFTALIVVWVGLPLLAVTVWLVRLVADGYRRGAGWVLRRPIHRPYRPTAPGNVLLRLRGTATDPATWRDQLWLLLNGSVGLAAHIVAVVEAVLDLLIPVLPAGRIAAAWAWASRGLLAPTRERELTRRVEQLSESRAETIDTQAAELRRIERDLHDGAQARLVALGMNLAMAAEQLERDPAGARELLDEARTASKTALAELRDLVRGIHPPVLADRGLVGAVQALALATPVPVEVSSELAGRLPAPVESAAYFAVAEGLTNAIKHSGCTAVSIQLWVADDVLYLVVTDNGIGGAYLGGGSGLTGIQRRLSAFDGTLQLASPHGAGTNLVMVLPCASSSPKTLPSSGTA